METWEVLWCNLLITVYISLWRKVSKTNHVWNLFMLLYEREQFLIVLLYLHVTFSIRSSSDIFNTVSCYKYFGNWLIALSTCVEACFVEESVDSLPVFNLGFCSVTFVFWSVESLEEEEDFLECLLLLMNPWLYLDLLRFNLWQEIFV